MNDKDPFVILRLWRFVVALNTRVAVGIKWRGEYGDIWLPFVHIYYHAT